MWWMAAAWAEDVRSFHSSELEVQRRVQPEFPESERATQVGDVRCLVQVYIGQDGVPYDASADCPEAYAAAAEEALLKWRWYPPMDGDTPVRALTVVAVTFRMDPEAEPVAMRGSVGLGGGSLDGAGVFAWHTHLSGYDGVYGELSVTSAPTAFSLSQGYFRNDLGLGVARWWGPVALGLFSGLGVDSAHRFWPDVLRLPVGVAAALEPAPALAVELTARGSYVIAGPEDLREPLLSPVHDVEVALDVKILPIEGEYGRFGVALGGRYLARATGPLAIGWVGFGMTPL